MRKFFLIPALALAAGTAVAADAPSFDSAYTDLDLEKCENIYADEETGSVAWRCKGYEGMNMYVAEGDLRMFVSYGEDAENEFAATRTLPPFNSVNNKLEWRLDIRGAKPVPVATILRFFTAGIDDPEKGSEVLVVTQLGLGKTCHIAYVDAKLNANANVMAREAADNLAGNVDCATTEPVWLGTAPDWAQ